MIRHFFNSISYFFHPLLMPLLGLYILFEIPTIPFNSMNPFDSLYFFPDGAKNILYIVMGILTLAAPILSLLIMHRNGMISSLKLENRHERTYPYLIGGFYYVLAYFYLRYQWPPLLQHPALLAFLFGSIVIFATCLIVNSMVKISLHAAGVFALVGGLLGYFQTQDLLHNHDRILIFILFMFGVAGIVAAGRVYMKAHSLGEVALGMIVGFLVMYVSVRFQIFI